MPPKSLARNTRKDFDYRPAIQIIQIGANADLRAVIERAVVSLELQPDGSHSQSRQSPVRSARHPGQAGWLQFRSESKIIQPLEAVVDARGADRKISGSAPVVVCLQAELGWLLPSKHRP
jgi:hypothetical protein